MPTLTKHVEIQPNAGLMRLLAARSSSSSFGLFSGFMVERKPSMASGISGVVRLDFGQSAAKPRVAKPAGVAPRAAGGQAKPSHPLTQALFQTQPASPLSSQEMAARMADAPQPVERPAAGIPFAAPPLSPMA